jgi:hypothetical protein
MRCAQCGSPLVPTFKNCPRCGVAIAEGQAAITSRGLQDVWLQSQSPFPVQERSPSAGSMPIGMETPQQGWTGHVSPSLWNAQGAVSVQPMPNSYGDAFEQQPAPQAGSSRQQKLPTSSQPFPRTTHSLKQNANRRSSRLGFMVSGLCVITSGLILIFVYFMSLSLPSLNGQTATDINNGATPVRSSPTTAPTQLTASPTPMFPGQQYIDNVQLARSVDARNQPVQVTTNFKVNQRMFVTFDIHTGGHGGTICLLWFLNTKQFSYFPLPVGPTVPNGYSYTSMPPFAGTGYVELYWGHIPSCTDPSKLLAQRVAFTVSA